MELMAHSWLACQHCHSPVSWQSPQVPTADPAPPPGPAAGEDELMGATALTLF